MSGIEGLGVTWFKRYRMHYDLGKGLPSQPDLAPGYCLLPWDPQLLTRHAEAKYLSFRHEIDANVFPSLAELQGCRHLMHEICHRSGFISDATWLAVWCDPTADSPTNCGTVQGINLRDREGSIQNLGVSPEHRGKKLAQALLAAALQGFQRRGMTTASLEVTARNQRAIQLYQQFGFRIVRSVYKAIEIPMD